MIIQHFYCAQQAHKMIIDASHINRVWSGTVGRSNLKAATKPSTDFSERLKQSLVNSREHKERLYVALSSFLHRGCPLSATVRFPWLRASVEQSARFRHGVNVAAHVQATPEDCTVRKKLLNTGCFRRLEHLPSHVILFASNFVRCPCSRSDIMPP